MYKTFTFVCLLLCLMPAFVFAQQSQLVKADLSAFDKKSAASATVNGNLLEVSWPTGKSEKGRIIIDLRTGTPLIKTLQVNSAGTFKDIAGSLDPAFILTIGKRDLVSQNGWNIFFDRTAYLPYTSHIVKLDKRAIKVTSKGSQTCIRVSEATAANFSGPVEITLYNGSPLLNIAAVMTTQTDSLAIIYDAGLINKQSPWEKIYWSDTENFIQSAKADPAAGSTELAVKYRTIVGENAGGSLAVFAPPHQYFYPLDNCYNLKFTWYGNNYRNIMPGYGIGIRHDLLGDRRWVPWFNAPPGTQQRLNFFCLISDQKEGKLIEEVKHFTHQDRYLPLKGYYTMCSHFHTEHVDDVLTHKPLPEVPGFVKAFRNTGVNIVHLGEFHGPGSPRGPEIKRFSEQKTLFDECRRLSNGNFLLLPGEEPNNFFGGHWMNFFPKPVYWIMDRPAGQPFVADDPQYGKVYRVGNKEDMLKLLEAEKGLAWTAHARTKGSTGFPDKYKEEPFFKSDRFLGAAWKYIPADLSQPRLGKRVFDLMDDMANWGEKKYVIAEADLFKIEPDYELYGHLNVNYLQLDKMPEFKDGWSPVLDAISNGRFFSTTGEVLLPVFNVNGKGSGETVTLQPDGKATIALDISWTFPLNFAEIISGDGKEVFRQQINLTSTEAFGKQSFRLPANLKNRKWVRVEVWDIAANGAFTQIVWLN